MFNNIKYITVREGDTYYKIAGDMDMELWQLYRYNDMDRNSRLVPGQRLYLQPKRRKAKAEQHVVRPGETMHAISQLHGIRLKQLYRKNGMSPGAEPKPGDVLFLRKNRAKPDLLSERINKLSVQRQ